MSLDTLLEAAKYLDHIENRDLSDCERHEYMDDSYHEDSEELLLPQSPSSTYHLKVDPNLPISVQFHTYTNTNGGLQGLTPALTPGLTRSQTHLCSASNTSTKRNAQQSGENCIISNNAIIRSSMHKFDMNSIETNSAINDSNNIKNKDHSSYSRHREMHKTLEKNRRAHLRHCFEILKEELPPNEYNEKKTSHINIISCAIRYIQQLKRTESELEHESERLMRSKMRFQSQIAQLKDDLRDLNDKSDIEAILQMVANDKAKRVHSLSPHVLEYEAVIDDQSEGEVIIEIENGEDCYDDETTTTASECADDIRDTNANPSNISGSLSNAVIYKCQA